MAVAAQNAVQLHASKVGWSFFVKQTDYLPHIIAGGPIYFNPTKSVNMRPQHADDLRIDVFVAIDPRAAEYNEFVPADQVDQCTLRSSQKGCSPFRSDIKSDGRP
jgi:hypothetical protein